MTVPGSLRLSAQRALLGRIHPEMRLVKVTMKGDEIVLAVILDIEPSERIREDVSDAATEIAADFPDGTITEHFEVNAAPLPKENILDAGWIYQRAENE